MNDAQKRAKFAYERVKEEKSDEYFSWAKKLPAFIVSEGLLKTIAFYRSKKGAQTKIVYHLEGWLKEKKLLGENDNLIEQCLKADVTELMMLTDECVKFAEWLKRFAEIAEKEKKEKKGSQSEKR